jgi:hypothetical protein
MIEAQEPDPYLVLTDPDLGCPKTCGSESGTLMVVVHIEIKYYQEFPSL